MELSGQYGQYLEDFDLGSVWRICPRYRYQVLSSGLAQPFQTLCQSFNAQGVADELEDQDEDVSHLD